MTNAEYLEKLIQIGWLDNLTFGENLYHINDFNDKFYNQNGFADYLKLAEGWIDIDEFSLIEDGEKLFKLAKNDLNPKDKRRILGQYCHSPQALIAEINQILTEKQCDKAFFELPSYWQNDFYYVYKPIDLYKKAIQERLIPMNNKLEAILFDLDGTLIDTAPDFIRIIKTMCQKHNHPVPSDKAIREQVSAGARAMVKLMFGDELANVADSDPKLLAYRQEFLDTYEADICVDSRLFDGLDDLLVTLESQGIPWGIVTNKPRYLAEILLDKLSLTERCSVLVCPDDVKNTKPDPEPMFLAVKILNETLGLNLTPENCVYVGDHIRDIQAGNSADMWTILAGYGYIPPEDSDLARWGADVIVSSGDELNDYLADWVGI